MTTTRRIAAVVCTAIALAAYAGPAFAGTMNLNGNGSYVESPPTHGQVHYTTADHAATPTIVHVTASSGFDWGDAAIGAAAGIAIVALLVGAGLTLTQHRHDGIRHA